MEHRFDHERLDVYQLSLQFVAFAERLAREMPAGSSSLRNQLDRAADSISLNIAEGGGEFAKKEKARFYRIAKRSTSESAGALDLFVARGMLTNSAVDPGHEMLSRMTAMLIKLIKSVEQ